MITLDSGVVESKCIALASQILHTYDATIKFIIGLAEIRIREEIGIEIDDSKVDRKERQLLLLKQAQRVEYYKREIETCEMAVEDAYARANLNTLKGLRMTGKCAYYLEQQEARISDFSTKIMERAYAFAKRLVIEAVEWSALPDDHKEKNKYMWTLQLVFADIIGTLDTGDEEYVKKFQLSNILANEVSELRVMDSVMEDDATHLSRHTLPDLLHLFKMLELTEIISRSSAINRVSDLQSTFPTMLEVARLVGRSMAMLPHFLKPDEDKVFVFTRLCLRSLSALLETPHAMQRFLLVAEEEGGEAKKKKSKGLRTQASLSASLKGMSVSTITPQEEMAQKPQMVKWSWGTRKFSEQLLSISLIYWTKLAVDCRFHKNQLLPAILAYPGYDMRATRPLNAANTDANPSGNHIKTKNSKLNKKYDANTHVAANKSDLPAPVMAGMSLAENSTSIADEGAGADSAIELQPSVSLLGDSLAESSFENMGLDANANQKINYNNMELDGFEDDADDQAGGADPAEVSLVRLMYDRIDASGLFTFGSEAICDLLRCCISCIRSQYGAAAEKCLPLALTSDRALINSASCLALSVLHQYLLELSKARAYNIRSPQFMSRIDEEAMYAIKVATAIYSVNIANYSTLDIFLTGLKAALWRPSNYFLSITTLQCLHTCLLAYGHGAAFYEDDESNRILTEAQKAKELLTTKERKNDPYKESIVRIMHREQMLNIKMVLRVLKMMGTHCASLTIQHVGLQVLRMLLRRPFCTKVEIQDLFEENEDEEADAEEDIEGESVEEIQSIMTARDLDKWRKNLWDHEIKSIAGAEANSALNLENWTLSQMINYVADTHLTSYEIMEQLLLLIQSLGMLSYLLRVTLLEQGVERILNRVIDSHNHDLYIMALVAACNDTLARVD